MQRAINLFLLLILVGLTTAFSTMSPVAPKQVVDDFFRLLQKNNYEQASELLADDVYFSSPKFTFKSKADWLAKFPAFHGRKGGSHV